MNQVLLCHGGNGYKLPHVGKLKIAATANGRDIPMRLPCCALIGSDHLDVEAITAAIVATGQGKPAHLFSLDHLSVTNLIDCCVSLPAATIGNNQITTDALLGLIHEGTADDEWIVGLDSLSIGKAKDVSMEDTAADGDAADGDTAEGAAADDAMIDLQQMRQRLHHHRPRYV